MTILHREPAAQGQRYLQSDVDPTLGAGIDAEIGSVCDWLDGTTVVQFVKWSGGPTEWARSDGSGLTRGIIPSAWIDLTTDPASTDTLTIGADVYEFLTAAASVAADTNVAVERGGGAAATFANLLAAINGTADVAHATCFLIDGVTPAVGRGTEAVRGAAGAANVLHIAPVVAYGSAVDAPGSPNIALAETLTAVVDWNTLNLNLHGGQVEAIRGATSFEIVVTAEHIAGVSLYTTLPFDVRAMMWSARQATGENRPTVADLCTMVLATVNKFTFDGGVAPSIQAGDIVTILFFE